MGRCATRSIYQNGLISRAIFDPSSSAFKHQSATSVVRNSIADGDKSAAIMLIILTVDSTHVRENL
jgi:hypothetical protein